MNTPHECAICHKRSDLFELKIPIDDDPNITFIKYVCGSCWEVIAAIARLATRGKEEPK